MNLPDMLRNGVHVVCCNCHCGSSLCQQPQHPRTSAGGIGSSVVWNSGTLLKSWRCLEFKFPFIPHSNCNISKHNVDWKSVRFPGLHPNIMIVGEEFLRHEKTQLTNKSKTGASSLGCLTWFRYDGCQFTMFFRVSLEPLGRCWWLNTQPCCRWPCSSPWVSSHVGGTCVNLAPKKHGFWELNGGQFSRFLRGFGRDKFQQKGWPYWPPIWGIKRSLGSWRLAHQYTTFNILEVFGDDVVQCPPLPNQNFGFFWSQKTKRLALRLLKVAEKHLNRHKERQEQLATWHKKRWLVFLCGSSNKTKGHLKKNTVTTLLFFLSFLPLQ